MAAGIKLTLKEFSDRSTAVHNNIYDYSQVVYVNAHTKVKIICPVHGVFEQVPTAHLQGKGCRFCQGVKTGDRCRGNKDKFVARAELAHGSRYNYDTVEYVNGHVKVDILCSKHGVFSQKPNHHCAGIGCPACGTETAAGKMAFSTEEFITKAVAIHGNKYDYSDVEYKNNFIKVTINCTSHGAWTTSPANHLLGSGCPACGSKLTGFDTNKIGTLYVLSCGEITKVGVTNRPIQKRLREIRSDSGKFFEVVKTYDLLEGGFCFSLEASILRELKLAHKQPTESFSGFTECFYNVDVALLLNNIELKIGVTA